MCLIADKSILFTVGGQQCLPILFQGNIWGHITGQSAAWTGFGVVGSFRPSGLV